MIVEDGGAATIVFVAAFVVTPGNTYGVAPVPSISSKFSSKSPRSAAAAAGAAAEDDEDDNNVEDLTTALDDDEDEEEDAEEDEGTTTPGDGNDDDSTSDGAGTFDICSRTRRSLRNHRSLSSVLIKSIRRR